MFILILLSIFCTYFIYAYFNVQIISDPVIRADRTGHGRSLSICSHNRTMFGSSFRSLFMSTTAKTSLKEFYVLIYVTGEPRLNQKGVLIDFMFCVK